MHDRRTEVAACGNYCGGCIDYRALAEDDDNLRGQVVLVVKRELNMDISVDQAGCEGCWGTIHNAWTASLECRIRRCVDAKGYATCAECRDFPCPVYLKQFAKDSEQAKNIRAIHRAGLDAWLRSRRNTQPADNGE